MLDQENLTELLRLIESTTDKKQLREILNQYHEFDIATILNELDSEKQSFVLSIFEDEELADILTYMDALDTSEILSDIDDEKVASIINEMEPDDAADVLEELDEEQAQNVLQLLDEDIQNDINSLSKYDEDTAGSIMNTHYLKAYAEWDVKDAMKLVVKEAPEAETINTIFIVDQDDILVGTLDLKKLIVTKSPHKLSDIMTTHFQSVETTDSIEYVVQSIRNYDTYLMPVVSSGIIEGIITMDDAFDALAEVVEEDYAKLGGLTEGEERDEKVILSIKKRLPWLVILLFLDLCVSLIISRFGHIITVLPILTFFQAAVLGLAGNCGTQALAVAVRRLGTEKMKSGKAIVKHLWKESLLGLCTGIVLGIVSFLLVVGMLYLKQDTVLPPVLVGLVLGISIAVAVMVSNLFGALVPVIFYKCKIDPAVASGPFITTINDIIVVVLYFSIAIVILHTYI